MIDSVLIIGLMPKFDKIGADVRFRAICQLLTRTYQVDFFAIDYFDPDLRNSENLDKYKAELEDIGLKVHIGMNNLRYLLAIKRYQVIWFEFYFVAKDYLELCRRWQTSATLVVDSVDVHYLRLERKALLTKDENDLTHASEVKKLELDTYGKADVVIAITEEDAEYLKVAIPNLGTEVIPNIHIIPVSPAYPPDLEKRLIFVGAYKHDPNVDGVLYFAKKIWPILQTRVPDIKLSIVGSDPPPDICRLASEDIEVTGYVKSTLPYLIKSMVSIAPLRYGAGMKGKVGEAMAAGIPVVSTSIGVEGMSLVNGKNILIADTPQDFADAVFRLLTDPGLRDQIRNDGINFIRENLSEEAVAKKLTDVFSRLPKSRKVRDHKPASSVNRFWVIGRHFLDKHVLWRLRW